MSAFLSATGRFLVHDRFLFDESARKAILREGRMVALQTQRGEKMSETTIMLSGRNINKRVHHPRATYFTSASISGCHVSVVIVRHRHCVLLIHIVNHIKDKEAQNNRLVLIDSLSRQNMCKRKFREARVTDINVT